MIENVIDYHVEEMLACDEGAAVFFHTYPNKKEMHHYLSLYLNLHQYLDKQVRDNMNQTA